MGNPIGRLALHSSYGGNNPTATLPILLDWKRGQDTPEAMPALF